jgi:hypothetical protein
MISEIFTIPPLNSAPKIAPSIISLPFPRWTERKTLPAPRVWTCVKSKEAEINTREFSIPAHINT